MVRDILRLELAVFSVSKIYVCINILRLDFNICLY